MESAREVACVAARERWSAGRSPRAGVPLPRAPRWATARLQYTLQFPSLRGLRQRRSTLAPDQKSESLPNYALYAVPPENLFIAGCADHQRCDSDAARIAKHGQIAARLVAIARLGLRNHGISASGV